MQTGHETSTPPSPDSAAELVGTPRRRLVTSAFIVLTLLAIGVSIMPSSEVKSEALTVARPYLGVTGLDQSWGVFSPDPRRYTSSVRTIVERADGTTAVIGHPDGAGLAEYWDYRRRLLLTQLSALGRVEDYSPYARWVADQDRAAGHQPVRVSLVRRSALLAPPGPGPDRGPWTDKVLFRAGVAR